MSLKYVLYAAGMILMLRAFVVLIVWRRLAVVRIGAGHMTLADRAHAAGLIPVFTAAEQALAKLGFHFSHAVTVEQRGVQTGPLRMLHFYAHAEVPAYAVAMAAELAEAGAPFDIELETYLGNGDLLATVDARSHLLPKLPPWYRVADKYLGSIEKQWQLHCERLAELPVEPAPVRYAPDEHVANTNRILAAIHSYRLEQRYLVPTDAAEVCAFSARAALELARRMVAGNKTRAAMVKRRGVTPVDVEAQVAADVDVFERAARQSATGSQGWLSKLAVFLVSAIAFAVVFGLSFSWRALPIFVGVLIFHELGHLFGMRLFGYRDAQILFLPFIGAAAIGEKEDATPIQNLIVYALGPVPGLVLGGALLWFDSLPLGDLASEIGLTAVILNGLNLLPFLPFDGGRIVETLFFARLPRARILFVMLSVCVAATGAWALGDVVFGVVALALAVALPAEWRWGRAVRRVTKAMPVDAARDTRVRTIFDTLARPPLSYPAAVRMALANRLLRHFTSAPASATTTIVGGLVYVGLLAAVVILPVVGLMRPVSQTDLGMLRAVVAHTQTVMAADQSGAHATVGAASVPTLGYACPGAENGESTPERSWARRADLAVVGTFTGPTAAEDAAAKLRASATPPQWTLTFGQSVLAAVPEEHRAGPSLAQEMRTLGGEVLVEDAEVAPSIQTSVICTAPDEQTARFLFEELDAYAWASSLTRAPWAADDSLTDADIDAERRVRSTYSTLTRHLARELTAARFPLLARRYLRARKHKDADTAVALKPRLSERKQAVLRKVEAAMLAIEDAALDRNFLARYAAHQIRHTEGPLAYDLYGWGADLVPHDDDADAEARFAASASIAEVAREGRTLRVRSVSFIRTEVGLPALAAYLCEQRCTDIKYVLTDPGYDEPPTQRAMASR